MVTEQIRATVTLKIIVFGFESQLISPMFRGFTQHPDDCYGVYFLSKARLTSAESISAHHS